MFVIAYYLDYVIDSFHNVVSSMRMLVVPFCLTSHSTMCGIGVNHKELTGRKRDSALFFVLPLCLSVCLWLGIAFFLLHAVYISEVSTK